MNWYKYIKIAIPLPEAEGYPYPYGETDYSKEIEKNPGKKFLTYNVETLQYLDKVVQNADLFDKYKPLTYLGSGTNGLVYYSQPFNAVIKVTTNMFEYDTAKDLSELQKLGKETPHVVSIYDTDVITENVSKNIYIIIAERVLPLNPIESKTVSYLSSKIISNPYYYDDITAERKKIEWYKDWSNKDLDSYTINLFGHAPDWQAYSKIFDKFIEMSNDLIGDLDFDITDLHGENVGKRKSGEYVLMDIGS